MRKRILSTKTAIHLKHIQFSIMSDKTINIKICYMLKVFSNNLSNFFKLTASYYLSYICFTRTHCHLLLCHSCDIISIKVIHNFNAILLSAYSLLNDNTMILINLRLVFKIRVENLCTKFFVKYV